MARTSRMLEGMIKANAAISRPDGTQMKWTYYAGRCAWYHDGIPRRQCKAKTRMLIAITRSYSKADGEPVVVAVWQHRCHAHRHGRYVGVPK